MVIKLKGCRADGCDNEFKQFKSTQKYCSYECAGKSQKTGKPKKTYKIPQMSKKRKVEYLQYTSDRLIFLSKSENQICFIDGCKNKSTTIEHRAGRIGKNYLDQKTWAGCCHFHNLELERDPELSKKYQLSKLHGGKKL